MTERLRNNKEKKKERNFLGKFTNARTQNCIYFFEETKSEGETKKMTKKKKGKLIFQDNSWILELKTVVSKPFAGLTFCSWLYIKKTIFKSNINGNEAQSSILAFWAKLKTEQRYKTHLRLPYFFQSHNLAVRNRDYTLF